MKMYLNYGNQWKSGVLAVVPAEITDVVEIVLPEGFKEVKMADGGKAIEWPNGQITIASEICTEHNGATAVPYIVDCSSSKPRKVYLQKKEAQK